MDKKHYLAAVLVFKDETRYLKEWLDYHILIGFQHFYLYDNNSDDRPKDVLKWYLESNIVTYKVLDVVFNENSPCAPHRMEAINTYGPECEWMAFTDVDEFFITNKKNSNMHNVLKVYEEYSAIEVRRLEFGSNFVKRYRNRPVIERFFRSHGMPSSLRPKVVAKPKDIVGVVNAHRVKVRCDAIHPYSINTNMENVNALIESKWWKRMPNVDDDFFSINHYGCKSEEEFLERVTYRGRRGVSKKVFDKKCYKKFNKVIDKRIFNYSKYIRNNFIQINYEKLKKYYKSLDRHNVNLKDFLDGI